jgi:NAD+ synthetase
VLGRVYKTLLPTYDVFDEDRYFEPAESRRCIEFGRIPIGVSICEDIWASPEHWTKVRYPVDPSAELASMGARLLINISASPWSVGKAALRRRIVGDTARSLGLYTLYVNQVGGHDELIFDGHSIAVDPKGHVFHRMASFAEDFAVVTVPECALLDDAEVETPAAPWIDAPWQQEIHEALVLGLRDYVRKSGHTQVVLGLSGGIDSALTAVIAADALGPENVWGVALPTRYSSEHSVEDARKLADNLGIRFDVLPIDRAFQALLDQMAPLFGGADGGLAEENLQARIRGMTLMALSNQFGHLVLATGNKSELAVGYCTLYGDMCGALSVIGDVTKTRVYGIAHWLNHHRERIPERTLTKPPSAELRPDQTDQDTLPPYDILDPIVEAHVENYEPAESIAQQRGIDIDTVRRILRLIQNSEYKRRQAAPVLKVTAKAFGMGRRMPIVARR